jgi:hypothetical protein
MAWGGDAGVDADDAEVCIEALTPRMLLEEYISSPGRAPVPVRITLMSGYTVWGTVLRVQQPLSPFSAVASADPMGGWSLRFQALGGTAVTSYPMHLLSSISFKDGSNELVIQELPSIRGLVPATEAIAENNMRLALNGAAVVHTAMDEVLTMPLEEAFSFLLSRLLQGFQFENSINGITDPERARERDEFYRQNPFRHQHGAYAIFAEVVVPAAVDMEALYHRFTATLEGLIHAVAQSSPQDSLLSVEQKILTVAVWAKRYATTIQFLMDANTRGGRNVFFTYALRKACAAVGCTRQEECPMMDFREPRWAQLLVPSLGNGGEPSHYQPFGDTYKDELTVQFLAGMGEYSRSHDNAPYFVYVGPGPVSPATLRWVETLSGRPVPLTLQEFQSGLVVPVTVDSNSATATTIAMPMAFASRPEWATVRGYFLSLLNDLTLEKLLEDPVIQGEVQAISQRLRTNGS